MKLNLIKFFSVIGVTAWVSVAVTQEPAQITRSNKDLIAGPLVPLDLVPSPTHNQASRYIAQALGSVICENLLSHVGNIPEPTQVGIKK